MNRPTSLICATLLLSTGLILSNSAFAQDAAPAAVADEAQATAVEAVVEAPAPPAAEAAVAPAEAPLDRAALSYSNKWRVKFDNEAKSDGTLVFRLVMKDTKVEPITVSIPIKKGTNENSVASKVKSALQKAFPRDFNVEKDDGESVLVKLNLIEGSSSLVLLSNDVKNLKIKIKKE
jgi:hypothetical protein